MYIKVLTSAELSIDKFSLLSCLVKYLTRIRDQEAVKKLMVCHHKTICPIDLFAFSEVIKIKDLVSLLTVVND